MRKQGDSDVQSISNGIIEDDELNDVESENSSEEPSEDLSEEIVSQPSSDSENDCSEQSSEDLDEEPAQVSAKEFASQPSEDSRDSTEQPTGDEEEVALTEESFEESFPQTYSGDDNDKNEQLIKESKGKAHEELFEEFVPQLSFDADKNGTGYHLESVPIDSIEKKRSLDTKDGGYRLAKKCKPEESAQVSAKEFASQPSEDSGDSTEQPADDEEEVEPTEESFEESFPQPYSDDYNDKNEQLINESEGKPHEEPFEEYVPHLSFDADNNGTGYQLESSPINSIEKKRSLVAKDGGYRLAKKCKPEKSLGPESDAGPARTDPQNKSEVAKVCSNAADASEKQEHTGSSGKRRRSRWDPQPECAGEGGEADRTSKRRKSRWVADDSQLKMLGPIQLPNFMKEIVEADLDPEILELKKKLIKINKRLQRAEVHDDRPKRERSPSPPPLYDDFGIRINSRDTRFHEKLVRDRQAIISRLIEKNPTFKPPPDYKPPKLYKKLYIPLKEYPGYNFVGLIIGPRGNTQKRMEKESGAKILLRGKGSVKDRKAQQKPDPSDNDDLHVLVEADNQKSLDDAVGMVEKLLIPVDEGMNEHKRAQLRELAKLNGNLKDDNLCRTCGKEGLMSYACPIRNSTFSSALSCDTCGGSSHFTSHCPLTMSTPGSNLANQQQSFLADLGGGTGGLTFSTPPVSSCIPWNGGNTGIGLSPSFGSYSHSGLGSTPTTDGKSSKEIDEANLFVGYLPQTVDEDRLRELFSPFGRLIEAKVIKDRSTGLSKGYGFVKFDNPSNAATAVARMNGYKIDGKTLAVKVAGRPSAAAPTPLTLSTSLLPKYPGPAMVPQDTPNQSVWPGPPGSMLPEPQFSSTKSDSLGLPHSSVFLGHSDSSSERLSSSHHVPSSSPSSLLQFPGNPDYPTLQYPSYFTPTSELSSPLSLTQPMCSNLTPSPWALTHPPPRDIRIIESEYEKFMSEM